MRRLIAAALPGLAALLGLATLAPQPSAAQQPSDKPVTIGVLTDMSGVFSDISGPGAVVAVRMAVEDYGGKVLGRPIRLLTADNQNKPDIGAAIARAWFDQDEVVMVQDLMNSAVALAVMDLAAARGRIAIVNGASTSVITNEKCTPTSVHYTWDTYALAKSTAQAVVKSGGESWYFLTVDFAYGQALARDTGKFVEAAGGKVAGEARHPLNTADLSSFLLQAQGSKAKVVGLANAGSDTINAIKTAAEFGIVQGGQRLVGLGFNLNDTAAVGLKLAQGLQFTEAFYWDMNGETRAWSKRFLEKFGKMPTSTQAGDYSSTMHYLKAVQAAGTTDAAPVMAKMREMPVDDFFAHGGRIRVDGRMVHDMYLMQVKSPAESTGPWDFYRLLATVKGDDAFRPLAESACPARQVVMDRVSALETRNLGDVLAPGTDPGKIVLIETGPDGASIRRAWTEQELDAAVDATARGLLDHGLARGQKVGVLSANRSEFVLAYLGAMRAGLVIVPINWKLPAETIGYICADSDIALLLVDRDREAAAPTGVPTIGFDRPDWDALQDPGPFESIVPAREEIGQILYTSGSTGRPKGVPLSHAGQLWAVRQASQGDVGAERLLVAAPMFHMNALFNLKFAFRHGASLVLMPAFSAPSYVAAIRAHAVTWLTSVPTMLAMVAREVGEAPVPAEFGAVRRIYMGSSPFGQSLLERVRALFPNATVANGYGTTESGPIAFGPHPDGLPVPDLSMGAAVPGAEIRLIDEDGRVVEGAGTGVLQLRTPALMQGYLNRPEQTAKALREGWYHTNDLMRRDEAGFFFFVGRSDDMFVSGGENIYPGEVEKLLERHPTVQQAVVVPVEDAVKQALPFCFVVPVPGAAPDEHEIRRFALAEGPAYAHPRWVEVLDAMPLAGTNKVDRAALRERAKTITERRGRG